MSEPALQSAFDILPEELARLSLPNDAGFLFGRMQRVRTWKDGAPDLGAAGRSFLQERFDFSLPRVVRSMPSTDGSTKLLLALADGSEIECVHMPRNVKNPRVTMCLTSQVGCGMGCTFCATAQMGFKRNLTVAELVAQVLVMVRDLGPAESQRITLVFMGMGEPLQNLDNVLRACHILSHSKGLGIPVGRMTISTSGLVSQIDKLGQAKLRPTLAVSLNATTDAVRSRIMPVGRTWELGSLKEALLRFPLQAREKLTLEYVLLGGENDSDEDADRLAAFAKPFRHNLNLIPFNAWEGSAHQEPTEEALQRFVKRMQNAGCLVTVRRSRGRDVAAACGQLIQLQGAKRARGLQVRA